MPLPSKFHRAALRGYPRTPGERATSHAAFAYSGPSSTIREVNR